MKQLQSINIITLISILSFVFYFSFSSCKKIENPSNGIKDTITYDLQKSTINIQFIDIKTNKNIVALNNEKLKVVVVGESKNAIADIVGIQNEEYFAQKGFLTLTILPDFTPSSGSPIRFSINYELKNYISSSKEITIDKDGDYIVRVFMENATDPTEGVSIEELINAGNLYNGVLFDDVTISSSNGDATVTIPGGIKLLDSDTNNLSGKLNITLTYYDGKVDDAFACIPGGVASSILKNNSISPAVFYNAGVISLEIYDSDFKKAAFLEEKSIDIEMNIPDGIFNPETGSNIKLGDDIQLFNYLTDTGLWAYDGVAKVEQGSTGGLIVNTSTNKTGTYNLGNYAWIGCNNGSSFEITGDCVQCSSVMVKGTVRKQRDNSFVSSISLAGNWTQTSAAPFSTGNVGIYIDWIGPNECNPCGVDQSINPFLIDDMCSSQTLSLPLINNGEVTTSITASFSGICASDTNIVILPSFGIWLRHLDSDCWRWSSMKNGQSKICNLIFGETYVIGTYYNGIWKEWELVISEETIYNFKLEFPKSTCSNTFGIL